MSIASVILTSVLGALDFSVSAAESQASNPADQPAIHLRVDPRVELFCIVFRLAEHPEYTQARTKPYVDAVEEQFGPFRDHAVVRRARELRGARGVGFDAVMSLAVHLSDDGKWAARLPLNPRPESLDNRWTPTEAQAFLQDLSDFAAATKFEDFFARQRPFYDLCESRMKELVDRQVHLEWFPAFFGERPGGRFQLVLAPLNGPNNYGPHVRLPDGTEELYAILGAWFVDDEGRPTYGAGVVETLVHEFTHSYTNPLIDRHEAELKPAGEKLYAQVAGAMERQAYGNWTTMMRETLVRACTIRYVRRHQGPLAAVAQAVQQETRRFHLAGPLAVLLLEYEQDRQRFATLEAFMPRIVAFCNEQAARPAATNALSGLDRRDAPRVVSITPGDGERNIDPALGTIRVMFDRPMRDVSWSFVGGPPTLPELLGKPSYDALHTTWTVPVRLRPDTSYEFQLNSSRFRGFQSEGGVPLEPVVVRFRTGATRSK